MPYVWRCQISYNGSGTFNINTSGQPVVTGTVISSTAFNALTSDLGTGLSTAITKDGQTTATARIPFAAGINSSLVTDATSTTTGSIITAGGVGIAKALYVGTTANIAGTTTLAGVTATSITDSGLTSGRVTFASTAGLLADAAALTWDGTSLTATKLAGAHNGTVGATTPSTGAFTTVTTTTSVAVGGSTLSGSGSGVQFPATQSASTDANTLDDYEEGTWTPGVSFNNASVGATYGASNAGNYVKIGKMVTVTGFLQLTNKGSSTGTSRITGLPFTPGGSGESGDFNCPIGYTGAITFSGQLGFYGSPGAAVLFPLSITSGGTSANLTDTAFGNSSVAVVSCTYFV